MDAKVDPPPRERTQTLAGRGGAMAYLDFGPQERPVDVVFSHANGFNARTYRSLLAPLGRALRIFAIDLRGHGSSTLPAEIEGRAGWSEFRDDLLAFLDAAVDGPVVLSGHSMGGTSSLLAAAAARDKVRSLTLFDPVVFEAQARMDGSDGDPDLAQGATRRRAEFPSREAAVAAYLGRGGFRSWTDEQVADYVAGGFRDLAGGGVTLACRPDWEASNFRMHRVDALQAFRDSRCPIRVLRAEHASTARIDDQLSELTASGRISVETVPGTSHFLPMERPELVRETLAALV